MLNRTITAVMLWTAISGCTQDSGFRNPESIPADAASEFVRYKEARDDSIELAEAYRLMDEVHPEVYPVVETDPVVSQDGEDAADDPAFWYDEAHPDSSLIFGTNKKGGIYAYNLNGTEVAYYSIGLINNIDIRQQVAIGNQTMDLLGGSNRTDNSVVLFNIKSDGSLEPLLDESYKFSVSDINEVYGFCLYKTSSGGFVVVNGKNGNVKMLEVREVNNEIQLAPYLTWQLNTQPEGMVADDENNILYIGEEENGIWKVDLEPGAQPEIIPSSQKTNNPYIEYDIEGLALYKHPSGDPTQGFLMASIQGSFSYAIFERSGENRYITSFKISQNAAIDQVEETDGIEVFSYRLNQQFPQGLLIVQDGFNYHGIRMENQNFKVIPLEQVIELIPNL